MGIEYIFKFFPCQGCDCLFVVAKLQNGFYFSNLASDASVKASEAGFVVNA